MPIALHFATLMADSDNIVHTVDMPTDFHTIFSGLCYKIAPLYILIFLGFIAGKLLKVDRKSIAALLFYIVVPIVFFDFALHTKMHTSYLLLPLIFYVMSITLSITYLNISKRVWKEGARPNVIGFAAGTGNTGYFGLPVALMLFDTQTVGIYMLMNLGLSLFDYTFGAYVMARGQYTSREAVIQVSRLPMIYAFLLGLLLNYQFGIELPCELRDITDKMRSSYVVLGMMIIGLGIASVHSFNLDFKFISILLSAKFIAAPIVVMIIIWADKSSFHLFDPDIHKAMMLMSFVPPAANTVIFATIHNSHPEEAATAVLIGTFIALIYLPAAVAIFF